MAEVKPTSSAASPAGGAKGGGFELRLEARKAFACLSGRPLADGARVVDLSMEVPDVRFPFDIVQGAAQFQLRLCELVRLEVTVEPGRLGAIIARLDLAGSGIASLSLALREGFAEGGGRLEGGAPFTFKAGLVPAGERGLSVIIYDARLYAPSAVPSAALPSRLARAAGALGRPDAGALALEPLPALLRKIVAARGWKVPRSGTGRLALARVAPSELRLAWDRSHAGPPDAAADPELLASVEGTRAFRAAEALLAGGDHAAAREAYLSAGAAASAHPFAAERLLSLLALEERYHDEALDLAAEWLGRRPAFAPALAASGVIRSARGETSLASRAFSELSQICARRGEELAAVAAADACFAQGSGADPQAVTAAVDAALALRDDHLPAFRALRMVSERTRDREGLLRACRHLAAHDDDDAEKARAHACLSELLLEADPASARLHLDNALRLTPDDPGALAALARAFAHAGEHLRAAQAHERLREIHLARGDAPAAAREALALGALWEGPLEHPENALIRYREARELSPRLADACERAAAAAERLGQWAEAADHYTALLDALDSAEPGTAARAARAHRALASVTESRLGDPAKALSHLEAALALEPGDAGSLERAAALQDALGRSADLLATLDRLAPLRTSPADQAETLAWAGDVALGPLGLADAARARFASALALEPRCRPALEGVARLAAAEDDPETERDAISRLLPVARDREDEAVLHDRLAAACERAGDLDAAARSVAAARIAQPTPARLAAALRLARAGSDPGAVAALLAEEGETRRASGDPAGASAAWLERATLLAESDPAQAIAAAAEARALAPGDPAPLRAQADLAERTGDPALELDALQALLLTSPPDAAALELRAARAALTAGDVAAARPHAERAALDLGAAPEALACLAEARLAGGDREGAAAALVQEARLRGGADAARLALEAVDLDPARAAEPLRIALEAGTLDVPRRADLLAQLASLPDVDASEAAAALVERVRLLAGHPGGAPAALAAAREAAARAPGTPDALDLLATLAAAAGDRIAAAEALLARAEVARRTGADDAASRLASAAAEALAAGREADGEAALREALALGLDPDEARGAWRLLAERAAARGDGSAERAALAALIPLCRTGEKPPRLLRLSALARDAGNLLEARRSAEEARALAPRDPATVAACREVSSRQGDVAAVAALLDIEAELVPDRAGALLLERARLLAGTDGGLDDADRSYAVALARLPPDAALAAEHARLRARAPAPAGVRPWSEPLEAFARRAGKSREAADAWLSAATYALAQQDFASALRCARHAYARGGEEPGFAGPLLARILFLQGAAGEALVLHRALFDAGFPGCDDAEAAILCRQLAELAEEIEDRGLALAALDRLLERAPHDEQAALRRFELDPDRPRAVRALADHSGAFRSDRARSSLLARAATAAQVELRDPALADALWRRARNAAGDLASALAAVEVAHLDAARADHDPDAAFPPAELLDAAHHAAAALEAAGDRAAAGRALEEAGEILARHGQLDEAARDLAHAEDLAHADGDRDAAARRARAAGRAFHHAGDASRAEAALRRALSRDRRDRESWSVLEAVGRGLGAGGAALRAEALSALADLAPNPSDRVEALVALAAAASVVGDAARAVAALEAALSAVPGHPSAEEALLRMYAEVGRHVDRARLLAARAERTAVPEERVRLRREAGSLLAADPASQPFAADLLIAALADAPEDLDLHRAAARVLVELGRKQEAIPHLAAVVHADPDDEESARELASAFAGRHHERAELFLARADRAQGAIRAARLREAAEALFAAGDDVRARAILCDAFDAWPADDTAFSAAVRDAAADVDRLDAVFTARARAVPAEAAGCHRARADALLASRRVAEAERAYEACLAVSPDDTAALAMLAECRAERGADEAAEELDARLCRIADAEAEAIPAALEARARYRLGLAQSARGRPEEGIRHLERALALAPDDARSGLAWAALASGHASRGDSGPALQAAWRRVERAAALGPETERREALEAGAAVAAQFGDSGPEAAAILEALLAIRAGEDDPTFAVLAERTAAALYRLGEIARAEAALASSRDSGTESNCGDAGAGGHLAAAAAFERVGAPAARVRAELERACDADPDGVAPWEARAAFEERQGERVAAARARLAVAIRAEGEVAARAALDAARLFEESGRGADAIRAYRAALAAEPSCVPAQEALAARASAADGRTGDAKYAAAVEPETARRDAEYAAAVEDEMAPRDTAYAAAVEPETAPHDTSYAAAVEPETAPRDAEHAAAVEPETAPAAAATEDPSLEQALAFASDSSELAAGSDGVRAPPTTVETAEALRPQANVASASLEPLVPAAPSPAARDAASRELLSVYAAIRETAPRALVGYLEIARESPADAGALAAVASLSRLFASQGGEAARLHEERARSAESVARFMGGNQTAVLPPLADTISAAVRKRVALPAACGPTAQLLALLAPQLETLFPDHLARRGAGPRDRAGPSHGPALHASLDAAARALGSRSFSAFVVPAGGCEIALENTQPPSVIVGAGAVSALSPRALAFAAARALEILGRGGVLSVKFKRRDFAILCELATRFAGGRPPALGLPIERAAAFLEALERRVPQAIRDQARALGSPAADELHTLDPAALATALRWSAARVALVYTGDPAAALEALARLDAAPATRVDPAEALSRPDLRELAVFALSDMYLESRIG